MSRRSAICARCLLDRNVPQSSGASLLGRLAARAQAQPEKVALIQGAAELTLGEFLTRISGAAEVLREAGVEHGDRVLISAANSPAVPILYFAIHTVGAVAVLVAPDTPDPSVAGVAKQAGAKLALLDREIEDLDCASLDAANVALVEASWAGLRQPEISDIADLLFTSGTTGKKKGVVLTHGNILAAGRNISAFLQVAPSDLQAVPLPLSHSFGLGCVRSMAWTGHALLIERGLVNPAGMLKRMKARHATGLAIVPSGLDVVRRMTGDAIGELASDLRFVELGSARITEEARAWLMSQLPATRLCHHYGMTEASRAVFTEYHSDRERSGTAGRAADGVTLSIIGPDGSRLPPGEVGEIAVSGDVVMSGYWQDPELTAERLRAYGLLTGDEGRLDVDGYLYLNGRRDDIINVGGRKVAPDEVEDVLRQHPDIADAVCVAVDDDVLGQAVRAYVVRRRPGSDAELAAWLKPRLEDYKLPRQFCDIDSVPRTDSGKIQRALIRRRG